MYSRDVPEVVSRLGGSEVKSGIQGNIQAVSCLFVLI